MNIPPPTAGNPYTAAAALDRQLRSPGIDTDAASSDSAAPDAGPDVVVTLSQGASSPSTYDATGKLPGRPTLDDLGVNAPDSLAHASESSGGNEATAASSGVDEANANANADADQEAAVAA